MPALERFGGWWRIWIVIGLCWMLGSAYRLDWGTPAAVTVHEEPYLVQESLGADLASGKMFTGQERVADERRISKQNDAAFEAAMTRGALATSCWGQALPPRWDSGYTQDPVISWDCYATTDRLWSYARNVAIMLSVPVGGPIARLLLGLLFAWIDRGFRLGKKAGE